MNWNQDITCSESYAEQLLLTESILFKCAYRPCVLIWLDLCSWKYASAPNVYWNGTFWRSSFQLKCTDISFFESDTWKTEFSICLLLCAVEFYVLLLHEPRLTQRIQEKVTNLESMVSIHCTTLLGHVTITKTSYFDTDFALEMKLTKHPLIPGADPGFGQGGGLRLWGRKLPT